MTEGERKGFKLIGVGLVIPLAVGVPWALFGDVVPTALESFFGPRALRQIVVAMVLLTAALLGRGVFSLIREARASEDPRAGRRKLIWLLVGSSLGTSAISGSVLAFYAHQHGEASRICAEGAGQSVALQRQALREAAAARSRVRFFNEDVFRCQELERELKRLQPGGSTEPPVPQPK
ncbi:MAG: hypothetical protein R3B89_32890 [Polyangiaceae bacterium]